MCKNSVTGRHWKKKHANEAYEDSDQEETFVFRTQRPRKAALKAYMLKYKKGKEKNKSKHRKEKKTTNTTKNPNKIKRLIKYVKSENKIKKCTRQLEIIRIKTRNEITKKFMCKKNKDKKQIVNQIKKLEKDKEKAKKTLLRQLIILDNIFFYKMKNYKIKLNKKTCCLLTFGETCILQTVFNSCKDDTWYVLMQTCKMFLCMFIKEWKRRGLLPSCTGRAMAREFMVFP